MKNKRQTAKRLFIALVIIAANFYAASAQDSSLTIQQIKLEIQTAEARSGDYRNWSPELRQAYDKSLFALYQAFQQATEREMERSSKMLYDISEPSARKPLEDYLAQMAQARAAIRAKMQQLSNSGSQTLPFTTETNYSVAPVPSEITPPANSVRNALISTRQPLTQTSNATATPANGLPQPVQPANVSVKVVIKGTNIPVEQARIKLFVLNEDESPQYVDSQRYLEITGIDGKATLTDISPAKTYKIVVERYKFHTYIQEGKLNSGDGVVVIELSPLGVEHYRAIVGIEQSGASSVSSRQNIFFNLFISRPILKRNLNGINSRDNTEDGIRNALNCPDYYPSDKKKKYYNALPCFDVPKTRLWGDIRLTSVPKQTQNIFKSFTSNFSETLTSGIDNLEGTNQVAVAFMAGLQRRIFSGYIGGSRFEFSLVGGLGATTPLSTESTTEIFRIPDAATDQVRLNNLKIRLREQNPTFDETTLNGKTNIAFVIRERNRFLRNYYGGFRFENYYGDPTTNRPVALFDVMLGQDEAVTGGRLRGLVTRFDAFFPLPIRNNSLLYLFGSANLRFARNKNTDPLLLPAADGTSTSSNANTLVFPIQAQDRDLYRIGIGLNLFNLFSAGGTNKNK